MRTQGQDRTHQPWGRRRRANEGPLKAWMLSPPHAEAGARLLPILGVTMRTEVRQLHGWTHGPEGMTRNSPRATQRSVDVKRVERVNPRTMETHCLKAHLVPWGQASDSGIVVKARTMKTRVITEVNGSARGPASKTPRVHGLARGKDRCQPGPPAPKDQNITGEPYRPTWEALLR